MDIKRIASVVQMWINEESDVSIEAVRDYILTMMKLRYACDPIRVPMFALHPSREHPSREHLDSFTYLQGIILDGGTHRGQTSSLKNSIMGTWTAVSVEDWVKDLAGLVIKVSLFLFFFVLSFFLFCFVVLLIGVVSEEEFVSHEG